MDQKLSRNLFILFFLLTIFSACKKEEQPVISTTGLYNFSFLKANNPELNEDIKLSISGNRISGQLPFRADIRNMIASFNYNGAYVTVNGDQQQSGVTENDFTQLVKYRVSNPDGSVAEYEVDVTWFTGLPIVFISTEGQQEINTKEYYFPGFCEIYGGRNYAWNNEEMKIRGRGHSTWYLHPKKPYQLKFENKTELLGMPEDKRWILLCEHSDKTLIRNKLAFEMGYMSNLEWTPESVYAEVFVNYDYRGTYNITQKVEETNRRVNIGDDGYLLELDTPDHLNDDDIYFTSHYFTIQIKEPETEFQSQAYNYIKNYILEFEEALYADDFTDPQNGYRQYVDIKSFADWYLINEIAKNQDARSYSSMFCHHIPGQKLIMGPIWDFDLGFGNVNYSVCEFPEGFWVFHHKWIKRMMDDPAFVDLVKTRFNYFYSQKEYFLGFIDYQAEHLKLAQAENHERWNVFGQWIWPNPVVFNSHHEEVHYLKNWFSIRMEWLAQEFQNM